jgi:hypothetical protein
VADNKILEQVIGIIMAESGARNPLHSRRMELLRVKKTGTHSDYFYYLDQIGDLIDMRSLTLEALISHIFLEQADEDGQDMPGDSVQMPSGRLATAQCSDKK